MRRDEKISLVQQTVAAELGVSLESLLGGKGPQRVAFARQVAMYVAREVTKASYPRLGRAFGRDHSTVIHSYQVIQRRIQDRPFELMICHLKVAVKRELQKTWAQRRFRGPLKVAA